jgi:hypothetical protein
MMRWCNPRAVILLLLLVSAGREPLEAAWRPNGNPVCTATGDQRSPCMIPDGLGGTIIVWSDNRNGDWDLYAQRIDAFGAMHWAVDGVPVCTASKGQGGQVIASDGAGGAIIAWRDLRSDSLGDVYAQRIDREGHARWTTDGVAICTRSSYQAELSILADPAHGAYITWFDYDGARIPEFCYYTQRVDHNGTTKWQSDGVLAYDVGWPYPPGPVTAPDGAGGLFHAWWQGYGPMWQDVIYTQRMDSSGTKLWSDNRISFRGGTEWIPAMTDDGSGGAIVAWICSEDAPMGVSVIAQRIDHNGNILWGGPGVWVGETMGTFGDNEILSDELGGAFVMWHDAMSGCHSAQRIGPDGAFLWAPGGIVIGDRPAQTCCADGAGGLYLAWGDTSIAAARFSASGAHLWEHNICAADGMQTSPCLVRDGQGGALIAWQDQRNSDCDIYAARFDSGGDLPVATQLGDYRILVDDRCVIVEWSLSKVNGDERFFVLRSQDDGKKYQELTTPKIQRNGQSFVYKDATCQRGVQYVYRIDVSDARNRRVLFESDPVMLRAAQLSLLQNYPNPFNPSTKITYSLPQETMVTVEIYDVAGRRVSGLVRARQSAGRHEAIWDGTDASGNPARSGVYVCRLAAGKQILTTKVILLR